MASLHVGTITYDWYPSDPAVRRLAEAAVDAGYSVDVICLRQSHERYYEVCNGVHTYRMPMNRDFGRSLPVTILGWCRFLLVAGITVTKLHLKHPYDVIHVHNIPDFLVFATLIPKFLGAKVILEVQDVCPELMAVKTKGRSRRVVKYLAILQERLSTAFADHVITVGWPFEELLLQRGVPPEKLSIILNSADPKLFPASHRVRPSTESSDETRPFILMYHGTLAERNSLGTAIRALALARQVVPQLRLDIKGRGEQLPILKQLAAELGVSDFVIFSESSPIDEIVNFIAHGDVGIIPYRSDDFMELLLPTKAYEFAWMHRPMIASATRGIRSMFRPESIFLCDPANPESFAAAIIDLYLHPEKCASIAANAAEDYIPYRWEVMAERYQQLLVSLSHAQAQEQHLVVNSELPSGALKD